MLARIKMPSAGTVIAMVALFVALGSGAYAAHTHRVTTQDLKNRAVTAPKIAGKAVTSRAIRKNAVRPGKIAGNAVRTRHIFEGAITTPLIDDEAVTQAKLAPGVAVSGPQGPQGPQGAKGDKGDVGPSFGLIAGSGDANPTANPDFLDSGSTQTITLPTAGRVLLTGHYRSVDWGCSNGPARAGLYVGTAPVAGTNRHLESGVPTELNVSGMTGPLPAGNHTLQFGLDCPQGASLGGGSASPVSYTGILLGG